MVVGAEEGLDFGGDVIDKIERADCETESVVAGLVLSGEQYRRIRMVNGGYAPSFRVGYLCTFPLVDSIWS